LPLPQTVQAAKLLLSRRQARNDFASWCRLVGFEPAKHHLLIINKMQEVASSKTSRYIILLMPPGVAKSTYTSKLFIPWYLGYCPGNTILACSYAKDLAVQFGRYSRNLVEQYHNVLGYTLRTDTKAADEWETSTGGRYFCAGVGAGIAGHRADLGLIDDYCGSQEDADSFTVREKQWQWFLNDFWPRVSGTKSTNDGSVVIIANRRHEDDLVGRLLKKEDNEAPIPPEKWEVIKLPFFAEEDDPIGRQPGEVIWPEKFAQKADQVRRLPSRIRAGLYQQNPRPDEGDYFKSEWLIGYSPEELPPLSECQLYGAGDFACSEEVRANKTAIGLGAWDGKLLYILPRLYWRREDTGKIVRAWLSMNSEFNPLIWWAEKGHISKSIGPFLRDIMQEQMNFMRIEEVTPVKDKPTRARSFQGLCEFGRVRFPKFAPWWDKAEEQLLTFPGGKEDDLVDMWSLLGQGVYRFVAPRVRSASQVSVPKNDGRLSITIGSLKKMKTQEDFYKRLAALDR